MGGQDVIEIMREGMFDRAPLSGLVGGIPVLDFRKAPGSRGGKAGEAVRFIAALRTMASQQNRDTFSTAELQVGCYVIRACDAVRIAAQPQRITAQSSWRGRNGLVGDVECICEGCQDVLDFVPGCP